MTPEEQALLRVAGELEAESIRYMVTGSLASSYHGRPRSTHDADIVIDPTAAQLERLIQRLPPAGFYVSPERARDAFRRRLQFNAIHTETACKIDLIVRKDRPFSLAELERRQPAELSFGSRLVIASPEDTILSKLEWARKAGGSEIQMADAAGVLEVNPHLDRLYVERWAAELGVLDLWRHLLEGLTRPGGDSQG